MKGILGQLEKNFFGPLGWPICFNWDEMNFSVFFPFKCKMVEKKKSDSIFFFLDALARSLSYLSRGILNIIRGHFITSWEI
jgi:hypothetical protein